MDGVEAANYPGSSSTARSQISVLTVSRMRSQGVDAFEPVPHLNAFGLPLATQFGADHLTLKMVFQLSMFAWRLSGAR